MRRTLRILPCIALSFVAACSGGDDEPAQTSGSSPDSGIVDAPADAPADGDAGGLTIGICSELAQPVVPGPAVFAYTMSVANDCHVIGLFLGFSMEQGQAYVDDLVAWTLGFLGCPDASPVQDYGPGHKLADLTKSDVDLLTQYYLDGLVKKLQLTPAQAKKAQDGRAR